MELSVALWACGRCTLRAANVRCIAMRGVIQSAKAPALVRIFGGGTAGLTKEIRKCTEVMYYNRQRENNKAFESVSFADLNLADMRL